MFDFFRMRTTADWNSSGEWRGRENYSTHMACSTQPSSQCDKIYFSELREYNDLHTVITEDTEARGDQEPCPRTQREQGARAGVCRQAVSLHSDPSSGL